MSVDETEIYRLLKEAQRRRRGYADFFSWPPNRDLEEAHVVALLAASLSKAGGASFTNVVGRGRGNDPPDAEALDASGRKVAFEVTELVDEDAIHAIRRGEPFPWADWSEPKLTNRLQSLIAAKSRRGSRLKGGPYPGGYMVLVYSDEPELQREAVGKVLAAATFAAAEVHRAFLLLSYDPRTGTYPCFELLLTGE